MNFREIILKEINGEEFIRNWRYWGKKENALPNDSLYLKIVLPLTANSYEEYSRVLEIDFC